MISMVKTSVVVPVYNAQDEIGRTIDALLDQDFNDSYEIIPVNDGSSDGTREILEEYSEEHSKVKPVNQKNQGPAAARNHGAREAKGEYILFTDSDCVPVKSWISEMTSSLEKNGVVGVQGRYECLNDDSTLARFVQYEVEERYERMEEEESIDFIGSYSAGYDREVFLEVSGFDEDFRKASGEDPELSYRLDKEGYRMIYNPNAIVKHEHPNSFFNYMGMNFDRGVWGRLLYKKHPDKKSGQSYNSFFYFLKIPLTLLLTLFVIFTIPVNFLYTIIFLIFLFLLHIQTSLYAARREKKFIFLGSLIIYFKFLFFALGIIKGYLKF
ncbi:MAG: glycosyltransferase family 2 protein [Candidatus Aenigmatarchaeota archaeon]